MNLPANLQNYLCELVENKKQKNADFVNLKEYKKHFMNEQKSSGDSFGGGFGQGVKSKDVNPKDGKDILKIGLGDTDWKMPSVVKGPCFGRAIDIGHYRGRICIGRYDCAGIGLKYIPRHQLGWIVCAVVHGHNTNCGIGLCFDKSARTAWYSQISSAVKGPFIAVRPHHHI